MASGSGSDSSESDSRCEYTHHREAVPTGPRIESMDDVGTELSFDDDGYWRCAHECVDGHDRCLFHLPAGDVPEGVDRSERLRQVAVGDSDASRVERRRRKQLVGAQLPEVDLADEKLYGSDNVPLDLRCAEIDRLNCRNARLEIPVDLRDSDVGELHAVNSTWTSLHAQGASIETMVFDRATLEEAYFEHVDARRGRFYFSELQYVNYHHSTIDWLNFMYADVGEAGFFGVDTDLCTFFGASLTGGYFNGAEFGYLNFEAADGTECHFDEASIRGASFDGTAVDLARFDETSFERARFVDCSFDTVSFDGADLGVATLDDLECTTLSLSGVSFDRSLSVEDAVVRKAVHVDPETVDGGDVGYVSLRETKLPRGSLTQPADGAVVYDLEKATLGEVSVTGDVDGRLVDHLRVVNTNFQGFDFRLQDDIVLEDAGYDVHSLHPGHAERIAVARAMQSAVGEVFDVIDDPDEHALDAAELENRVDFESVGLDALPADATDVVASLAAERVESGAFDVEANVDPSADARVLESTYQKAKNGASDVGHTTAAGRFFERERKFRRHGHRNRFLGREPSLGAVDRFRFGTRWFRSALLSLTAGYGERPWRAIGSSFGVILLFTGVYSLLRPPLSGTPNPDATEYLVFSLQSFVAFIVGAPPETSSLWIRIASALEGFFGAFFVALFVFTLTRTVHR